MTTQSPALSVPLAEAARMLGVSVSTVRRQIDKGDLTPIYLTSDPVIRVSELEALLDAAPTEKPRRSR